MQFYIQSGTSSYTLGSPVTPSGGTATLAPTLISSTGLSTLTSGGTYSVYAVGTSTAGTKETGSAVSFVADAQPSAPSVTNTGYINAADASSYTVTGTGTAGDTVTITVGSLAPVTTTVDSSGNFSTTVDTHTLADGPVTISATQTDAANNTSTPGTATVTKQTVTPTISSTDFTIANAASSALTSSSSTLTFTNPVEVFYYVSTDANNATSPADVPTAATAGTQATTNIGSSYVSSIPASTAVTGATIDGTKAVYVRYVDQAGNASAWTKIN